MRYLTILILAALAGAGCGPKTVTPDELNMRAITLPNGQKIRAEVEINDIDMQRGMMFRDSIERGHGMLFIHDKLDFHKYWMYQVKIPLDIIWLDGNRRIVEISADTPPCRTKASECPTYGGHEPVLYALELGGGEARHWGLQVGQTLEF